MSPEEPRQKPNTSSAQKRQLTACRWRLKIRHHKQRRRTGRLLILRHLLFLGLRRPPKLFLSLAEHGPALIIDIVDIDDFGPAQPCQHRRNPIAKTTHRMSTPNFFVIFLGNPNHLLVAHIEALISPKLLKKNGTKTRIQDTIILGYIGDSRTLNGRADGQSIINPRENQNCHNRDDCRCNYPISHFAERLNYLEKAGGESWAKKAERGTRPNSTVLHQNSRRSATEIMSADTRRGIHALLFRKASKKKRRRQPKPSPTFEGLTWT